MCAHGQGRMDFCKFGSILLVFWIPTRLICDHSRWHYNFEEVHICASQSSEKLFSGKVAKLIYGELRVLKGRSMSLGKASVLLSLQFWNPVIPDDKTSTVSPRLHRHDLYKVVSPDPHSSSPRVTSLRRIPESSSLTRKQRRQKSPFSEPNRAPWKASLPRQFCAEMLQIV